MSEDRTPETHNAAMPVEAAHDVNPLIELAFKPDVFGKRPAPARIQLLLSYSRDILAEAEIEYRHMIDGPDKMRESVDITDADRPDTKNKVLPCT